MSIELPHRKRSDLVVDRIKSWIVSEGRRPGDRLPQERELIEIFGVSRGTIREALKSLEVQGLIRMSTGPAGGATLASVSYEVAAELLGNYFFFRPVDPASIYQVRKLLEPELVVSAMGNLTDLQIAQLKETIILCRADPQTAEDRHRQRLAELQFHDILADACTSPFLQFQCKFMNHYLSDMVTYKKMYGADQENIRKVNIDYHENILVHMRRGDALAAREEMAGHMRDCECHLEQMEAEVAHRFLRRG